ncbi:MAG: MFS transporter, partial [Deltaproteobacteria bacterium]|nr:MFS transporter [Deltaproteobacteria bacterium]
MEEGKITHSREFRARRAQNWIVLGTTYAMFYMGRYNLSLASPDMVSQYGWDSKDLGFVMGLGSFIYAISMLINGPWADRIGGKKAILFGALGVFAMNAFFALGSLFTAYSYFLFVWAVNNYFQSFGAISIVKVNAAWFVVRERGVFSAIFGTMIQGGRLLIFALGGYLIARYSWPTVFIIPSVCVLVMYFLTRIYVKDTPQEAGYPALDTQDATSGDTEEVKFSYLAKRVFTNPIMITIALAEFCTGFLRKGIDDWFTLYMTQHHGVERDSFLFQFTAQGMGVGSIVGAILAGVLSDKLFQSRRAPMAVIYYAMAAVLLAVFSFVKDPWMQASLLVLLSLAITGCHSLLSGTASMDFGGKKAAASAAAMFDGCQ